MNELNRMNLQMFAVPANETVTGDVEPAISIDLESSLAANITELQSLLGIVNMEPMAAGTLIKLYTTAAGTAPAQVAEGEEIALTKVQRKLAGTIELALKKYRRQTTAEAIQKVGQQIAINKTDAELITVVRQDIKTGFYTSLAKATGTATGTSLQAGLASGWNVLKHKYKNKDVTPIYFVSTDDVSTYLANAQVTLQTVFGFDYLEKFLGLGTTIVTPELAKGTAYVTAKENLHGGYVPMNGGDVAQTFGLTSDETGLVGITHKANTSNASIDTLIMAGVAFFAEEVDGVIKITTDATGA